MGLTKYKYVTGILILIVVTTTIVKQRTQFNHMSEFNIARKFPAKLSTNTWALKNVEKWIVVTTIQAPTKDMEILNAIPDWQLLVIGDTKTPENWSLPGAIFISYEEQLKLTYSIVNKLPTKRYVRKNIGYLFAIEHGARYIYESDDDNKIPNLDSFTLTNNQSRGSGLLPITQEAVVNPYEHFGQSSLWPRGYPLEYLGKPSGRKYVTYGYKTPIIQQGIVNGDPDMDAIFRITRKPKSLNLNLTFDSQTPNLVMPMNQFAPFNSQTTLFHRKAFWALLLPVSVNDRATDIYRSYVAQKLLHLIHENLAFIPPYTEQTRNPWHKYLVDMKDELEIYFNMGKLIDFLIPWKCPLQTRDFFECFQQLISDMVSEGFYQREDEELTKAWLYDLKTLGYNQPQIHRDRVNNTVGRDGKLLTYYPWEQKTTFLNTVELKFPEHSTNHKILIEYVLKQCDQAAAYNFSVQMTNPGILYENILLVIQLTHGFDRLLLMESLYRRFFPHILYCGKVEMDKDNVVLWKVSYVQLQNASAMSCVQAVIEMGYHINSLLYITDETSFDQQSSNVLASLDSHNTLSKVSKGITVFLPYRYGNRKKTDSKLSHQCPFIHQLNKDVLFFAASHEILRSTLTRMHKSIKEFLYYICKQSNTKDHIFETVNYDYNDQPINTRICSTAVSVLKRATKGKNLTT